MLTSIDHVWGICVTNRRSTFSQWGPGGGVLDHPSNEHQYFPPPPHHSRALNERLPSQPPARLYVRPSRQQLPPWIQLQLCNNMFWHFFRGWGGGGIIGDSLAISRQSNCRQLSHFAICRQSKCRQSINRLSSFLPPWVHTFPPSSSFARDFSVRRFWKMNQKKVCIWDKKINKKPLWLLYKIVLHNKRPDGAPWATTVLTFDWRHRLTNTTRLRVPGDPD